MDIYMEYLSAEQTLNKLVKHIQGSTTNNWTQSSIEGYLRVI